MDNSSEIDQAEIHLKRAEADLEASREAERHAEHEIEEALHEMREAEHEASRFIEVRIDTTSGTYPEDHPARVPVQQLVEVELAKAANALTLTDTTKWVALIGKRVIDPKLSFEANRIQHEAVIDWGPSEGGGGA